MDFPTSPWEPPTPQERRMHSLWRRGSTTHRLIMPTIHFLTTVARPLGWNSQLWPYPDMLGTQPSSRHFPYTGQIRRQHQPPGSMRLNREAPRETSFSESNTRTPNLGLYTTRRAKLRVPSTRLTVISCMGLQHGYSSVNTDWHTACVPVE